MKLSYWLALLTEWRNLGRDGFTIPFIIGSQKYLPDTHKYQNIDELLINIIQNNTTPICIKYCITTEDIILEIFYERKQLVGQFPSFKGAKQTNLFLTSFLYDLGADCETVISTLSDRYQHYIDKGDFSLNDRHRGDYSEKEKKFIKSVYAKL